MPPVQKTTVYLIRDDYRRLKEIAAEQGASPAFLVREAVGEYVRAHAPARLPRSIGMGRSERGDLSERDEELLVGFGEEGLERRAPSPRRRRPAGRQRGRRG
jgi:hypothetical protein